jgi:protein SCO1
MLNRLFLGVTVVTVGIVSGWLIFKQLSPAPTPELATPVGGDFSLASDSGEVSLQDFRGKIVILYFGYTFCPDICPTSLAQIAQALDALDARELERIQAIFISVDPERDTTSQLARYTRFFHPGMIGLTGSDDDIRDVARRYGAAWQKVEGESAGGYLIDHTSNVYVLDASGQLDEVLPHDSGAQHIVEVIRRHLRNLG